MLWYNEYKDFDKSHSYNTNFNHCIFDYASLRGASLKSCSFRDSSFIGTEFIGTNLNRSVFKNAFFQDAIFYSTILTQADFENATFKNTYFLSTNPYSAKKLYPHLPGTIFLSAPPPIQDFNIVLIATIQSLRQNDILRRSGVLHQKKCRVNTLSLLILLNHFSQDELIQGLPIIANTLTTQFHTLSYLINQLNKIKNMGII
ncbi:MAG: pentapeptide repeat-containing protein [Cellulosilyticaceae bacterium]